MRIAIAGKGGTGKTTIAAILARLYARDGYSVMAIDCDPDMNLASALGIAESPEPISEMKELIYRRTESQMGLFKVNPKVDDIADRFGVIGPDGVKLLVMGTVETGGSGCVCPESAFLNTLLRRLVIKGSETLIMDMEAGIEHLGRGIARHVDKLITIVEPGKKSIETAKRIKKLASDLRLYDTIAIANKVSSQDEVDFIQKSLENAGITLLGSVPFDSTIMKADMEGVSPLEYGTKALEPLRRVKRCLEQSSSST